MKGDEHIDWTIEAMLAYGGGFVRALADLYRFADPDNQRRLREAFPEYWTQYAELAALALQREKERQP